MKKVTIAMGLALSLAHSARAQVRSQETICIRPENVESVEVLKGARAQQQYGIKDGEGVVIITTKVGTGITNTLRDCPPPGDDQLARFFFPPELVMMHQAAINLSPPQRSAIQDAVKEAQGKFVDAQFKVSTEVERLKDLLEASPTDEARVLEQIDRVLTLEREVKRAQLSLMIRIKNQLSEQQKMTLAKLRLDGGAEAVSPPRGRGRPE